jgi:uncharacterized protein YyaL (SSP411 family)
MIDPLGRVSGPGHLRGRLGDVPNRLAAASSPYLLQHQDNPVDWWEWGEEAFAEARRRDVPVLLSVGYAACHWCHVMAHESFEDPDVAEYVNAHFVPVKVDREERPDVDAVYMEAVQAMTGHGGWPMTAFLTPQGEPFHVGTYFPPTPRFGMPSFRQVLEAVWRAWVERRDEVDKVGAEVVRRLSERPAFEADLPPDAHDLAAAVRRLATEFDVVEGGFGGPPKFPPSMVCEFLLRHHARTGDRKALEMVETTLEAMARGGIYDQLAGGFARYSVDDRWVVPHFEKMLYDNALLLRVYAHWYRTLGSPVAERIVRETAEFLLRDLRTPEGGFASALDADAFSPDAGRTVEGATYVWTPGQLIDVLGKEDGEWAAALLHVTDRGTFEHGTSTLQLRADPPDPQRWLAVRARLFAARNQRPQPLRDDKVVTAWNGLAVAALAEAGALLDEPAWVDAAVAAADLLIRLHVDDQGRLIRTSREGVPGRNVGVLEDSADLAEGMLALLAVTGDAARLSFAEHLLDEVLAHFTDREGEAWYDTADDAEALVRRPYDPTDNATPSGQSAAAGALLSFAAYTGSARHRAAAEKALRVTGRLAAQAPRFCGWGLAVAEAYLAGPLEVAVVGGADDPRTRALHRVALSATAPGTVVAVGDPADPAVSAVPLLRDRPLVRGAPAAYVCRNFVCDLPRTDPHELGRALRST